LSCVRSICRACEVFVVRAKYLSCVRSICRACEVFVVRAKYLSHPHYHRRYKGQGRMKYIRPCSPYDRVVCPYNTASNALMIAPTWDVPPDQPYMGIRHKRER